MLDRDLVRLAARDPLAGLDRLEQDIWRSEQASRASAVNRRRLMSWQGGVLAVAVLASAMGGAVSAAQATSPPAGWFGAGAQLAPASLLLGTKP
jgi:hypothetical protein